MIRFAGIFMLVAVLALLPVHGKAQSIDDLILQLNLNQGQIDQIRWYLDSFARKQANIPTAADVALQNRATLRQVITTAPFNQAQAQQVAQQTSAVAAQRMVNRLELRNQIFQVLTPQQQGQYIQMVQDSLAGLD
jgi:Spy/CpxP family protein refolding chaperone